MDNSAKKTNRVISIILSVILFFAVFAGGFLLGKFIYGSRMNSLEWAIKVIEENYYGDIDLGDKSNLTLKGLSSMLDPYSDFYTAEAYRELTKNNAGDHSGLGIRYLFVNGVGAVIETVEGNSPACNKGIKAGDVLVAGSSGGNRVEFTSADIFSNFVDGKREGEEFTLYTSTDSFIVSKENYTASYACMYTKNMSWKFAGDGNNLKLNSGLDNEMDFLPSDSAYIRLSQFYGGAAAEMGSLIKNFNASECTRLIIDLRNNGGGFVTVMCDIAGYFVKPSKTDNVAMTCKFKDGTEYKYYCKNYAEEELLKDGTEVVVLSNSGTASASEALMGALISYDVLKYENIYISDYSESYMDYYGGNVKTKQTYGKGIMQSTFENRLTGEAIKLTTAGIFWPNGKSIHDVGFRENLGCRLSPADWRATKGDKELRYICENYF